MADTVRIDWGDLKAARAKYLKLGREIERGASYGDMSHTHSKLGIFLEGALGPAWRGADGAPDLPPLRKSADLQDPAGGGDNAGESRP